LPEPEVRVPVSCAPRSLSRNGAPDNGPASNPVCTQAGFDVRVASSGQVVTTIGITRHIPGRHREHAANEPVRSAKDDRYQRDAAEIEAPKPVTAPVLCGVPG
jgi:hypothetical protein